MPISCRTLLADFWRLALASTCKMPTLRTPIHIDYSAKVNHVFAEATTAITKVDGDLAILCTAGLENSAGRQEWLVNKRGGSGLIHRRKTMRNNSCEKIYHLGFPTLPNRQRYHGCNKSPASGQINRRRRLHTGRCVGRAPTPFFRCLPQLIMYSNCKSMG